MNNICKMTNGKNRNMNIERRSFMKRVLDPPPARWMEIDCSKDDFLLEAKIRELRGKGCEILKVSKTKRLNIWKKIEYRKPN